MRRESIDTKHGSDRYLFMDASEILEMVAQHESAISYKCSRSWTGDDFSDFRRKVDLGDEGMVADSESFLASIEDQIPVSPGWRNIDDVVGAVPNIPAFLAGHPQHMRRRERTARENAPLAIYMDLTSSGGIGERDVMRRGVVLLALTRMLVEHRAVELWVGSSLGQSRVSGTVAWCIDTAPLDLARAAYHVAATSMSRAFGYGLCQRVLGTGGNWPFSNYELHCATAADRLRPVLNTGGQLLYIPPIYLHDQMTRDPVGWLRRVMDQYVRVEEPA